MCLYLYGNDLLHPSLLHHSEHPRISRGEILFSASQRCSINASLTEPNSWSVSINVTLEVMALLVLERVQITCPIPFTVLNERGYSSLLISPERGNTFIFGFVLGDLFGGRKELCLSAGKHLTKQD